MPMRWLLPVRRSPGTPTYAARGINRLMPTAGLCRVGLLRCWSAWWWGWWGRHNPVRDRLSGEIRLFRREQVVSVDARCSVDGLRGVVVGPLVAFEPLVRAELARMGYAVSS